MYMEIKFVRHGGNNFIVSGRERNATGDGCMEKQVVFLIFFNVFFTFYYGTIIQNKPMKCTIF